MLNILLEKHAHMELESMRKLTDEVYLICERTRLTLKVK